ncbi:hypothetical protein [Pseudomonas bohemica]|uniref:hypothetical protein n=1 Tax=Pseudomonas bohemica TaxID=2044872 RepID=UPI000DA627AD|nr:hypothetical protein [Pseudomonas bohemica]
MQPIHLLILALGVALAFVLFRITTKALAKDRRFQFAQGIAAGRIEGQSEKLSEHNALQQADLQTLIDVSTTLHVAHKFWTPITGTEPYRRRVVEHLKALNRIATRIQQQGQTKGQTLGDQEKAA